MIRRPRLSRLLAVVTLTIALAGCGLPRVEPLPDQGQVPGGQGAAPPGMPAPIGPMVEIGRGRSLGVDWRYTVYESVDGTCTSLDAGGLGSGACGGNLEIAGPLLVTSIGSASGGPSTVEGLSGRDVAEVWVEGAGAQRVQATLLSLARAGYEGQVFFAFLPAGAGFTSIVALDGTGDELHREPLDIP